MDVVTASFMWGGPDHDVLCVFVEPTPEPWGTQIVDGDVSVFRVLDEHEEATGPVAGVEVIDFLRFDDWNALPRLDLLWQIPGWEPLPLDALLRREQAILRERARQMAERAPTQPAR